MFTELKTTRIKLQGTKGMGFDDTFRILDEYERLHPDAAEVEIVTTRTGRPTYVLVHREVPATLAA